jgi:type IV secretion system protein VirB10
MPNGKSIVLERQPGTDTSGYSGLEDEVDNRWGALFKAALLSTLLSVGSEAGTTGNENDLVQAIRRGGSESSNQVGQRVVSRNLDIQPTLTIRPGFPVRVIVNRDLVLAPYNQEVARSQSSSSGGLSKTSRSSSMLSCRRPFIATLSPMPSNWHEPLAPQNR